MLGGRDATTTITATEPKKASPLLLSFILARFICFRETVKHLHSREIELDILCCALPGFFSFFLRLISYGTRIEYIVVVVMYVVGVVVLGRRWRRRHGRSLIFASLPQLFHSWLYLALLASIFIPPLPRSCLPSLFPVWLHPTSARSERLCTRVRSSPARSYTYIICVRR